jgi:hypothetical protein
MEGNVKHYILLCRPRFEVAMIKVEDVSPALACRKALEQGPSDPSSWTLLPFDEQSYWPHVERCLTEPEVEISAYLGEMEKTAEDEVRVLAQDENTRYLLLKADTFLGEGQVVRQPWMSELSPISERDLCGDWVEALQASQEEVPRGPASVLPFPGRDGDDEDEG